MMEDIQASLDSFNLEESPREIIQIEPEAKPQTATEKREKKKFVNTLLYGLQAPFVFPNDWAESISKESREKAKMLRLAQCAKCVDEEMSTDFEAMLYISCLSLVAPLNREWSDTYFHIFSKYYDYSVIDDKYPAPDIPSHHISELNRLRQMIFKRQWDSIKSHS